MIGSLAEEAARRRADTPKGDWTHQKIVRLSRFQALTPSQTVVSSCKIG